MSRSLYAMLRRRYGTPISRESRRDFLRVSIAAGAGLMLGGCAGSTQRRTNTAGPATAPRDPDSKRSIIVIGAGFAGLACAYELLQAGHDVRVFEARNRVGGRVLTFTDFVPGKVVEGGAELIGSNHPLWVSYADKFGLEMLDIVSDDEAEAPIIIDGQRLTAAQSALLWEELEEVVNQMNALAEPIDADEPWNSPDAAALDARTIQSWIDDLEASDICKKALGAQLAGDNGVANDKASLLCMLAAVKGGGLEKYWTESEVYRCKGGNQQLAIKLAEALGTERLELNEMVQAITPIDNASRQRIDMKDGRHFEADDVVLTVPPSAWKHLKLPGLAVASDRVQMGTNIKYLAAVKSRFWEPQAADALTNGDVTWFWEATNNQGEGPDHAACLTAFSGGPAAECARARQGEPRRQAYHVEYERVYPGFATQFVQARFMDWPSDPWTGAGYSFPAPGQLTAVGRQLHQGFASLHIAGEHTCPKFIGYMEGALQSGVRIARKIAGGTQAMRA